MTDARSDPGRTARLASLLLGLTLIAYLPILHGGFIWDDDDYVTNNPNLSSVEGLSRIWLHPRASPQYYPLVHTSFWIEQHLWGLSAPGYHIVNVLLHATSAFLMWRVLVLLDLPGAFLATCLFAVHPVNVESVAWITERKNVLSGVFYFASALAYLRWEQRPRPRDLAIAFVLFIAALFSKTVTCSLPATLLLIVWWKRGTLHRRHLMTLVPMLIAGAALAFTTAYLEVDWVRARGPEWDYSIAQRILLAGRALWFYLAKLVLPVNLSFVYPQWPIDATLVWQWAFPLGVVVALFALWQMRNRWGRGPLVAALIFIGTLMPALGFFNIYPMRYTFVADHYAYHATAAMLALIAVGLHRLLRSAAYVVIVPLIVLTMIRASIFADVERLWRDTLAKNPNSWMVNLNLAKVLNQRGQKPESWQLFARLVELTPQLPETHWNYGSSLAQQGLIDQAIAEYTEAIRIGGDPLPQVYELRGQLLLKQGKTDQAERDFAQSHLALSRMYAKQGDPEGARVEYQRALQFDPSLRNTITPPAP